MRKFLLVGLLFVSVISAQGCILLAGAAVGGSGVAYALGKLEHNVDEDLERTHKATLKALEKLDMYVVSEKVLFKSSKIEAQTVEGKEVKIDIESLTEKASKISIRVGLVGDEERSYMILGAIQKQL